MGTVAAPMLRRLARRGAELLRPATWVARRRYRALEQRFDDEFAVVCRQPLPSRRAVQLHTLASTMQDMAAMAPACAWSDSGHGSRTGLADGAPGTGAPDAEDGATNERALLCSARVLLVLASVEQARFEDLGSQARGREPGIEHCASAALDRLCSEHHPEVRARLLDSAADAVRAGTDRAHADGEGTVRSEMAGRAWGSAPAAHARAAELLEALADGERHQLQPLPPASAGRGRGRLRHTVSRPHTSRWSRFPDLPDRRPGNGADGHEAAPGVHEDTDSPTAGDDNTAPDTDAANTEITPTGPKALHGTVESPA